MTVLSFLVLAYPGQNGKKYQVTNFRPRALLKTFYLSKNV
jgi:hypothetical protein